MNISESILSALGGIGGNKTRSILTMFGIVVGISSVIMIISIGQGVQAYISNEFEAMGLDSFSLELNSRAESIEEGDRLTYADVVNLRKYNEISMASGSRNVYLGSAVALMEQNKTRDIYIQGVDAEFFQIQKVDLAQGRPIAGQDLKNSSSVVILDEDFAQQIYGKTDVIGEKFNVTSYWSDLECTVIGLEKSNSSSQVRALSGRYAVVYMPLSYVNASLWDSDALDSITLKGTDQDDLKRISDNVIRLTEIRHGNEGGEKYTATITADFLKEINTVISVFTAFLGFVAAISLLVGGIGVMNIMLVSVTERTREIGIRKSLGATSGNIKLQFLIEAVILTGLGGVMGILTGYGGGVVLGKFASMMLEATITPVLTAGGISIVVGISAAIGIVFGVYPAGQAAKLDPVESLRFEN